MLFEKIATSGHEEVVFCHNQDAGLKAIIAIHNTVLGPALGGLRMWPYKTEQDALDDVLRLSKGMTYKAAVAGLNLGGGKSVIIGDPNKDKSEALFRAFGRFVNSLGGRYITAEDVGIDVNDMEYILKETEFVTGVHQVHGGSGDPSPFTAYGTLQGLMASLNVVFGNEDVGKYTFAVQGVGHVGMEFVKLLREQGAKVFVTDINEAAVRRAVDELGCEAVATEECGYELQKRGILYAPDYAVNAGGLMNVSIEFDGYNRERAMRMMRTIYYNLGKIFEIAKRDGIPTFKAADRMAEERIAQIGRIKLPHMGNNAPRFQGRIRGN
jgi:leucine dehydrogenase